MLASEADSVLDTVYRRYIGRHEKDAGLAVHDDKWMRERLTNVIEAADLDSASLVQNVEVDLGYRVQTFLYAWLNGQPVYADGISFDLSKADRIYNKGEQWALRLEKLHSVRKAGFVAFVNPPHRPELFEAFDGTLKLMQETGALRNVFQTQEVEKIPALIATDLRHRLEQ